MKFFLLLLFFNILTTDTYAGEIINSPDGKISVNVFVEKGSAKYSVEYNSTEVLQPSLLGVNLKDIDFTSNMKLINSTQRSIVRDKYKMIYAKHSEIEYIANKASLNFQNKDGKKMSIIFQVSNDGVAFRYQFFEGQKMNTVLNENTSYKFPSSTKAWLQPMQTAKSGWEQTNPAYEEDYQKDIAVGTKASLNTGFIYPALFKYKNIWMLITEAAIEPNWCATHIDCDSGSSEYNITFPDPREVIFDKNLLPKQVMNGYSPWRIITIGSLKTIIESTLGTNLANPSIIKNNSYIKPGKASWSWINSKDDFIIYNEQKKYVDFASDMNWQYCLIDVNWDSKIGYDKIKQLADYAKTKNVGLLLWYNSAGDWNNVKYTPKNKLITKESRTKEFSKLKAMGIKGVKIDFFGGDGQSVIKYYVDILKDAAQYELLVNFHGATLPRGWSRTYPNLLTVEAVKGFENVTFGQQAADEQAKLSTLLPFTRNAFDPMDYTPMNLYKVPTNVVRRTTSAFELATTIVFLSGIQHMSESPEGMKHVPEFAKNFLRSYPDSWDETRFIDGFPGKLIVIARRKKDKWYIGGMNGEMKYKTLELDLNFLKEKKATLISDDKKTLLKQENIIIPTSNTYKINIEPNGGFVMIVK